MSSAWISAPRPIALPRLTRRGLLGASAAVVALLLLGTGALALSRPAPARPACGTTTATALDGLVDATGAPAAPGESCLPTNPTPAAPVADRVLSPAALAAAVAVAP